jgi:hypothetical protein
MMKRAERRGECPAEGRKHDRASRLMARPPEGQPPKAAVRPVSEKTRKELPMRTDEDFLRLETENRLLKERLSSLGDIAGDFKAGIAALLAPRTRERPELQFARRLLASKAGVPALCDRRECRRGRACLAEDNPPHCREHWPRWLTARFDDVAAGIELSALCREQEEADFHAYACEQLGLAPDGKAQRKKRSGKAAA